MSTTQESSLNATEILEIDGGPRVNVPGLVAIIVFYLIILGIGLWAAWKKNRGHSEDPEVVMLAGRDIGLFVGCLTMTATWVGGGYINGSAEAMYTSGLLWCQAPIGYSFSLACGGLFFARKMRERRYMTILDPLQECFGRRWGAMLYLPAVAGDTLWSAAILAALGSTLAVILSLSNKVSIISSAVIAVVYTMFGGLYSVAYTDVLQLFCIFFGLWLVVPFAMMHEAVGSLSLDKTDWVGSISEDAPWEWGEWIDYYLLLTLGGVPWQAFFQRILSARTSEQSVTLSLVGGFGCLVMAIPACFIGVIAKGTDWTQIDYRGNLSDPEQHKLVLPLVIQYLTPQWVAFFGLGAVSAAVMSSADSSVLSASSMFANNVYKNAIRQEASEKEMIWVMRASIVVVAAVASSIAIIGKSIYQLFYLCGDFVYVMLFPQFTMAVHFPHLVNTYGSIFAYFFGFILRIIGGEPVLQIPPIVKYPYFINNTQYFPFRTLAMLITFASLVIISWVTQKLYDKGYFKDILHVFDKDNVIILSKREDTIRNPSLQGGLDNPGLEAQVNGKKPDPPSLYKEHTEMAHF